MGNVGRPRKEGVPREFRECRHHGRTEFAKYSGAGFRCMACHRERLAIRGLLAGTRKTDLDPEANDGTSVQGKRHVGGVCPTCREVKPLTGVCDNCD